jgi:phosphoglycerate dehydrogenase-like enzyme
MSDEVLLIASPLRDNLVADIRLALGSRGELLWRPDLYPAEHDPAYPGFADEPAWSSEQRAWWDEALARATVVLDQDWLPEPDSLRKAAPRLRWLQGSAVGLRPFAERSGLADVAVLTTAAGIHAVPLAEHVLAGVLTLRRDLDRVRATQQERAWRAVGFAELYGSSAVVVGLGGIGSRVAHLLHAFGVEVVGAVREHAASHPDWVRQVLVAELDEELPHTDLVVLCCPLTDQTLGLLSAARLARMRPDAIVVNVGRGPLVDEAALVAALELGRLGGAVLDTFVVEPLPTDHPLWTAPRTVLTPHAAGLSRLESDRLVALFLDNLELYLEGYEPAHRFVTARQY